MWITKLELENVKSYADCDGIVFAHGVNAISGPNGAGKSTLLEAIGFALFDSLPYTQADFLRQGAKRGKVAVHFIDALDEREYVLVRPLSGGTISVVDPKVKRELVSGKEDVVEWLKRHFGVEPTSDLRALFEDAIGVPQGLLAATFLENAATRKRKFDPLLQVDDYVTVWNRLRDSLRYLREALQTQEQRIAGLQGELKRLPELKKDVKQIKSVTAQDEKELKGSEKRLNSIAASLAGLDTDREQIEGLAVQVRTLDVRLEGLAKQVADADEAAEAAQRAQKVLDNTRAAFEAYEAAQVDLAALDGKRKERDTLRDARASVEKNLVRTRAEIEVLERSMGEIEAAEAGLSDLEPEVSRQERLDSELKDTVQAKTRLDLAHERRNEETETLERLKARLAEVEKGLKRRAELEKKKKKLEKRLNSFEAESTGLEAEHAVVEHQRAQIADRLGLLETADEAVCPVCRQALDAAHFENLNQHYADELAALDEAADLLLAQADEVRGEVDGFHKNIQAIDDKLTDLPLVQQGLDLKKELRVVQRLLKKRDDEIEILAGAPGRIMAIERELKGLGDPRAQVKLLQVQANLRGDVESKLKVTTATLATQVERTNELQGQLESFHDLEDQIATAGVQREKHAAAHRRYLENASTAESLAERAIRLKALEGEHKNQEKQKAALAEQLTKLEADYDRTEHEKIKAEHEQLARDRAALEERLKLTQVRMAALEAEMTSLSEKEADLREAQNERDRLGELIEVLEFVRKTVRDAGPYVTRAMVQTISLEANRIYTDIMGDYTMRLQWNEDYSISVEQGGDARSYSQLSGGEKMAAALAVRLALLREMSQIRVAFFDEPTANLDDIRRENLAAQITQITGFNQLFVISHDDTFERETHHVIRVYKDGGVSRVEVG